MQQLSKKSNVQKMHVAIESTRAKNAHIVLEKIDGIIGIAYIKLIILY